MSQVNNKNSFYTRGVYVCVSTTTQTKVNSSHLKQ